MNEENKTSTISEITRRNVFDYLRLEAVNWAGRLEETEFLSRLYDLKELPSYDRRFPTMEADIWQHRVNNPTDWDDDWVYDDERLNLLHCSDEAFLNFLCEILHPVVRPDTEEVSALVAVFNETLAIDGWQIVQEGKMAGRPIYAAQQLIPSTSVALESAHSSIDVLNAGYVARQVKRMQAAIESDPELAIGTAKEFVETICKTILDDLGEPWSKGATLLDLIKQVKAKLKLLPESIPERAKGVKTIKRLLSNLGTIVQSIAELRGPYGTGHGKSASTGGLQPRHARLAVGAATTLGVFLFETYQARVSRESGE